MKSSLAKLTRLRFRRIFALALGAVGGYAYYHYVGCASGTCPITGNPWMSTAYGALIGWFIVPARQKGAISENRNEGG